MPRAARILSFFATALVLAGPVSAQHEHHNPPPVTGWAATLDSNAFLTANFQERKFRDFHQVESQNWLMGMGTRRVGTGTLTLHGMLSFEPFTLRDLGSSQVFQTGETFEGAPLIDYQHPHDLIMGLSMAYERPLGRATLLLRGGPVDEPALGPTAFMHRASSSLHPTAPLSHHQIDSTHITPGVITAGARRGSWQVESSIFRGREPDENRLDIDFGALDSYSVRGSWINGGTHAQISVGWLEDPDVSEPGDVTRMTASVEFTGLVFGRDSAITVAWGQNREAFATENGFLAEGTWQVWRRGTIYARGEIADKHIIGAGGQHPPGLQHPHVISTVGLLMGGYSHEIWRAGTNAIFIGGDVSGYRVPTELVEPYGQPVSFHLFGRWVAAARK
jgi:hypothetical protein